MSEWMPIDTAPKDGTPIDIWIPRFGGMRLTNMRFVRLSRNNCFFDPVESGPCCVRDATHWMPLPEPPK